MDPNEVIGEALGADTKKGKSTPAPKDENKDTPVETVRPIEEIVIAHYKGSGVTAEGKRIHTVLVDTGHQFTFEDRHLKNPLVLPKRGDKLLVQKMQKGDMVIQSRSKTTKEITWYEYPAPKTRIVGIDISSKEEMTRVESVLKERLLTLQIEAL